MRLKRLELSGFKSFPKTTKLEFSSPVTAVVGPNGSGKSNIKESIQWVLGEQSMKSLRGKKGEDLIWNGSPQIPRMGKGSVTLIFDNRDGKIPMDFEEVVVSRKIFRDGMNEYFLNGSQVRLRDLVELVARIGLGETKHNIIGQGEVDRFLLAPASDKRSMLEEALGLRVYQIKKKETERKLSSTAENMKQVESLLREITPHLRFLRLQAEKHKNGAVLKEELQSLQRNYLSREKKELDTEERQIRTRSQPLKEKIGELQKEINSILQKISLAEKRISKDTEGVGREDKDLLDLNSKRRELEREIGRLEGRMEIEKEKLSQPSYRQVDIRYVGLEIERLAADIKETLKKESQPDFIKKHLERLADDLDALLGQIKKGSVETRAAGDSNGHPVVQELQKTIKSLQDELALVSREAEKKEQLRRQERSRFVEVQSEVRELDSSLRAKQEEERDLALQLERLKFEEEKFKVRRAEFEAFRQSSGVSLSELSSEPTAEYQSAGREDIKRKIERLHIKLDEAGSIDVSVLKEFEETEARHIFLTQELEDLKQAYASLKELLKELEGYIKNNFKEGLTKVREEFNKFFRIIFGGGKASVQIIKPAPKADKEGLLEENEEEKEEGIEMSVDLPGKRIRGLAMLSGGERALTSIALLFAITAINPPPFLILDETDAALDEANTQRYANILKELSKHTQLILVTHNRETMKAAGILYGVTMGDDGASRLLSLKLEEAEVYTNR